MAQTEAQKKYDKENTRNFSLKLNYNTDANLIMYLESLDNIQGYLKQLIEHDLTRRVVGGRLNETKQDS